MLSEFYIVHTLCNDKNLRGKICCALLYRDHWFSIVLPQKVCWILDINLSTSNP